MTLLLLLCITGADCGWRSEDPVLSSSPIGLLLSLCCSWPSRCIYRITCGRGNALASGICQGRFKSMHAKNFMLGRTGFFIPVDMQRLHGWIFY
ncbi:hypothetical protein DUNSADRAFT_14369 [Dunaliella salina]|uniref:Secreted protein n=1 Tax=Dunaliella salina TaxID=3046 RepID=A0ABQ7G7G4_DUNSA|nr:hypothetical protein DUNSADRAFT_14369 [Dunaliella salina]|eukprot:KAF5830540.1 hypothetical protein DUNSADRAFT_14369 [Dunaliella salina]